MASSSSGSVVWLSLPRYPSWHQWNPSLGDNTTGYRCWRRPRHQGSAAISKARTHRSSKRSAVNLISSRMDDSMRLARTLRRCCVPVSRTPSRSGHICASRSRGPTLLRNVAHVGCHCAGRLDQHARGTFLPRFEGHTLSLHLLGYFGILIPLLIHENHQPASQVFGNLVV